MKTIGAWFGVFLMVLTGYFAFWPIPIAPVSWAAPAATGYVGPHAQNTGDLVSFTIQKEESSSAGVRRIKAVIGRKAD